MPKELDNLNNIYSNPDAILPDISPDSLYDINYPPFIPEEMPVIEVPAIPTKDDIELPEINPPSTPQNDSYKIA